MIAGRHGRRGFDIVAILVNPFRPSEYLGLRYIVSAAYATFQRYVLRADPALLSKIPLELPDASGLGLMDATSNVGGVAACCWAKRIVQKEAITSPIRRVAMFT